VLFFKRAKLVPLGAAHLLMNISAACMQAEAPSRAKLMFYLQTTHCKYAAGSIFSPLSVRRDT